MHTITSLHTRLLPCVQFVDCWFVTTEFVELLNNIPSTICIQLKKSLKVNQFLLQIQFSINPCLFHHWQISHLCYHWSHLLLHWCLHLYIHQNHNCHGISHKCQLVPDYLCICNWYNHINLYMAIYQLHNCNDFRHIQTFYICKKQIQKRNLVLVLKAPIEQPKIHQYLSSMSSRIKKVMMMV